MGVPCAPSSGSSPLPSEPCGFEATYQELASAVREEYPDIEIESRLGGTGETPQQPRGDTPGPPQCRAGGLGGLNLAGSPGGVVVWVLPLCRVSLGAELGVCRAGDAMGGFWGAHS